MDSKTKVVEDKKNIEEKQDLLFSLFYAKYKADDWGDFAWIILFCIALFWEDLSMKSKKALQHLIQSFLNENLANILPCKTCVLHYVTYTIQYPVKDVMFNCYGLFEWMYNLKQMIKIRIMKHKWMKLETAKKWEFLLKKARKHKTLKESIVYYRKKTQEEQLYALVQFLHFVSLTYPDLKMDTGEVIQKKTIEQKTSKERRDAIQYFMGHYVVLLLPLPKTWIECWKTYYEKDIKVWVNSLTLMIAIYQCYQKTGLLKDYCPEKESIDLYINKRHLKLVSTPEPEPKKNKYSCACTVT